MTNATAQANSDPCRRLRQAGGRYRLSLTRPAASTCCMLMPMFMVGLPRETTRSVPSGNLAVSSRTFRGIVGDEWRARQPSKVALNDLAAGFFEMRTDK